MLHYFNGYVRRAFLWLIPMFALLVPLGSRAAAADNFGYIFAIDNASPNWISVDSNNFVTTEFDVSGCINPAVAWLGSSFCTLYASPDGETFTVLTSGYFSAPAPRKLLTQWASIPHDTRYLKAVTKLDSSTLPRALVISDMAYGYSVEEFIEPQVTKGTYADGMLTFVPEKDPFYTYTDHYASVSLQLPEPVSQTARTLHIKLPTGSPSLTATIHCKDGQTIPMRYESKSGFIYKDSGFEMLLPTDAESVDLELSTSDRNEILSVAATFSVVSYALSISDKAVTPLDGLGYYYDFDGDGVFEAIRSDNSSSIAKFMELNDGTWQLTTQNHISGFNELFRMEPDGLIYGVSGTGKNAKLVRTHDIYSDPDIIHSFPIGAPTAVDYNLDGQSDYLYQSGSSTTTPDKVASIKPDGGVAESILTTMTPAEYAGVRSELKLSTGGEGVPGWGDMFGRDVSSAGTFDMASVVDINSDGLPDFINPATGYYFLNTGDGAFVESTFGNRVCFRDFDGDGINDILEWDYKNGNVRLYLGADITKEPQALFTELKLTDLYVRDIDNDGDLDVVGFINSVSPATATQSYLVISENQGNGKFRKREHYIGEQSSFHGLLDIDADGKYEALCVSNKLSYLISIKSPAEVSMELIDEEADDLRTLIPLRPDQSGRWLLFGTNYSKVYLKKMFPANSRPQRPEAPTLVFDAATGRLNVSWPLGSDKETPSLDLTYELRIGTAPGLGDIVMAQALADGSRRNLLAGLNGYSTHAVYNTASWPEGKIYISYQVIDDGFMGSEFSEAAVFEKKTPASDFVLAMDKGFATRMQAEATPAFTPEAGTVCTWDISDGEIINIDEKTQAATFRFATPGTKTISLTVESAAGTSSTTSKNITVEPVYFTANDRSHSKTIDLDGDGHAEVFSSNKFYAENDEGVFEELKKSFNLSTGLSSFFQIADVNADGLADAFLSGNFLINYGDGDMEKVVKTCDKTYTWLPYDFNNDGLGDVSPTVLNAGDYLSTKESGCVFDPPAGSFGFYPANMYFYDFNGDGLTDVGMIASETGKLFSDNLPFHIYENIDGRSYKRGVEISAITTEPKLIDDIDGDGKADFVMCDASYGFGVTFYSEYIAIIWGSGAPTTMIQCPDGDPYESIYGAFDFNNDGMKDISVSLQSSNQVITLYRDGSYSFTEVPNAISTTDGTSRMRNGNLRFAAATLLAAPNERPTPPSAIRSTQSAGAVTIEWNAGTDKETPASALRYNIAIKRKGADGEGAYFMSPMNGGNPVCALPSEMPLLTAPRITIPVASIPAGEYEVTVQTVDGQYDTSDFSEVYNLTVRTSALVELPSSGMIGSPVTVRVSTNAADADLGFGSDVSVTTQSAGIHTAVWHTEGLKEIKVNGESVAGIYIYPVPDADFTLPEAVAEGALVNVTGASVDKGIWEIASGNDSFTLLTADSAASIESAAGDSLAIRFKAAGTFTLRHTIEENYGSAMREHTVAVGGGVPAIDMVTADGARHRILWNSASAPDEALAVRIYREGSRYNVYDVAEEVPASSGEYTDPKSDAAVKSARYRISYVMPYGESSLSEAHQPMHVQINRGIGSAINLSWSRYEGMDVDSYRILKGSDEASLAVVDVVSGHLTSFTDMSDDAPLSYYSIEVVPAAAETGRMSARAAAGDIAARSNVVCGADARAIVQATEVLVSSTTGSTDFNGADVLSLQARMLPTDASITKVNWEMADGDDIMSVDAYGNVTAKAYGKATVRAVATDGSGACGEIELNNNMLPLTWLEFTSWPENHTIELGETFRYIIRTEPANASEKPLWTSSNPQVAEVTQDGVVTGLQTGYTTITVSSQLDPDMFIDLGLSVVRPAGYVEVTTFDLNIERATGVPGDIFDLNVRVLPDNATDKRIVFDYWSGDPDVATYDSNGRITITGIGLLQISITSVSNPGICYIFTIEGVDPTSIHPIQDIEFYEWPEDHTLAVGETFRYGVNVSPSYANESPFWESSDTQVATVDENGLVTALAPGYTVITAASRLNNIRASLGLTVTSSGTFVAVSGLEFGIDRIAGAPGDAFDVAVNVLPADATDKRVQWHMSPDNTDVAVVDSNGRVTITGFGAAHVVAVSVSNPEIMSMLPVTGTSGLESVFTDDNVRLDVYNVAGVRVLRQASLEDVKRLLPGVYIAGGRRICVLPPQY